MKKMKVFYLIAVLALLSVSVVMVSCKPKVSVVPDGFVGVPWGASKDQIKKIMSERGHRHEGSGPSINQMFCMAFSGKFANVPCELEFRLVDNSFYEGNGDIIQKETTPTTFNNIVDMLSAKYGPPNKRESSAGKDSNGKDVPGEEASWDFVDNKSSDEYTIQVNLNSFNDDNTLTYSVHVYYRAFSLERRLRDKLGDLEY